MFQSLSGYPQHQAISKVMAESAFSECVLKVICRYECKEYGSYSSCAPGCCRPSPLLGKGTSADRNGGSHAELLWSGGCVPAGKYLAGLNLKEPGSVP